MDEKFSRKWLLNKSAAPVFVLLWSTGFLGAKLGLPYALPLTLLLIRFLIVVLILAAWVLLTRAKLPELRHIPYLCIVGILIHFCYLGGVFYSIHLGMQAAVSALIVGLQPGFMTLIAWLVLGEKIRGDQLLGIAIGIVGTFLVLQERLALSLANNSLAAALGGDDYLLAVSISIGAVLAISLGSIIQKHRIVNTPMASGNMIQYAAAAVVMGAAMSYLGAGTVQWSGEFIFALAWLVIVLSLGAISIYYFLISRGAAANIASLFFLVPSCTAVLAMLLFGETLTSLQLLGMVVSAFGLWMVTRKPRIINVTA